MQKKKKQSRAINHISDEFTSKNEIPCGFIDLKFSNSYNNKLFSKYGTVQKSVPCSYFYFILFHLFIFCFDPVFYLTFKLKKIYDIYILHLKAYD